MRILYLSQLVPYPADAGPKMRSYHVLRYLSQAGRQVTLLAFSRPDDDPLGIQHLNSFLHAVHTVPMPRSRINDLVALARGWLSGKPFVIQRDFSPAMLAKVEHLLQSGAFDAVHADQLGMDQYVRQARQLNTASRSPLQVLDEHNACFQIFQRLAAGSRNPLARAFWEIEWRQVRRYEARACAAFDHVVTVTAQDRLTLQNLISTSGLPSSASWHTIPICTDTQNIAPVAPQQTNVASVLHLGTMFWLPNIEGMLWFARQVWPLVQAEMPATRLVIAGKKPPPAIQALAGTHIQVTGYVADPQPLLAQAAVFIVPLLSGSGMRVKIIDGWRWGLPIVSTTIGAEGIEYVNGENILIADQPQDFAAAILRLLREPQLAERLRINGRAWVEKCYEWRQIYQAWDTIYPRNAADRHID